MLSFILTCCSWFWFGLISKKGHINRTLGGTDAPSDPPPPSPAQRTPCSGGPGKIVIFRIHNRYLWSVILKFSQKCFWDSRILVHCWFNSYFTLITKEKLHFSLIHSFYCCLVKGGWVLKSSLQFAIRGLVAYKPIAYKKTKCIVSCSLWGMILVIRMENHGPHRLPCPLSSVNTSTPYEQH